METSHRSTLTLQVRLQLRERLPQYSTLQDAINLITSSRRILVLTGAGISKYGLIDPEKIPYYIFGVRCVVRNSRLPLPQWPIRDVE